MIVRCKIKIEFLKDNLVIVIGAKLFSNLYDCADVIISYIKQVEDEGIAFDESTLIAAIIEHGFIAENSDSGIQVKTVSTNPMDVEINDAIHNHWLDAFSGYITEDTFTTWYTDGATAPIEYGDGSSIKSDYLAKYADRE